MWEQRLKRFQEEEEEKEKEVLIVRERQEVKDNPYGIIQLGEIILMRAASLEWDRGYRKEQGNCHACDLALLPALSEIQLLKNQTSNCERLTLGSLSR